MLEEVKKRSHRLLAGTFYGLDNQWLTSRETKADRKRSIDGAADPGRDVGFGESTREFLEHFAGRLHLV